jgi:hypothetical protein
LKRAFLGWLRGEREHCKMAAIPTTAEEDAKRPHRERETLVQFRLELKQAYLPDLPACRLIFKVDPAGRVILPASETSEVLTR